MPLTCVELDASGCEAPDCGHDHSVIFLNPRCHPAAGVEASYFKVSKRLRIACKRCKNLVAEIAVARELV